MLLDKAAIFAVISDQLRLLTQVAIAAANQAHETATHSETVARSKYETFGLEAAYLAHGQAQRVADCKAAEGMFDALKIRDFTENDAIDYGAVVIVCDCEERAQLLLIGPAAGGVRVKLPLSVAELPQELDELMVITPSSPLGSALMGRYQDDEVVIHICGEPKQYVVLWIG
ncbi:GreA/GreB family elongation factor [Shewanella mesophila]|uniref:GreA/GreB family elongation factor n=1 Tax=Shewanella mesophila TaxID=2864208 RepID=UPI001C65B141|nr:GreA/GreB family elongation factor [Shewanella mesophila]QYJ84598.1 GreA/GreB family elongation factor [Shewanella mesophila]